MTSTTDDQELEEASKRQTSKFWWWFLAWAFILGTVRIGAALSGSHPISDPAAQMVLAIFLAAMPFSAICWIIHTVVWALKYAAKERKRERE